MAFKNGNVSRKPTPQINTPLRLKRKATNIAGTTVLKLLRSTLNVSEIPSNVYTSIKNISGTQNSVTKIQKIPRKSSALA